MDFPLVILVDVVPKQKKGVQSVQVVMLVNRVRVREAPVSSVLLVNRVHPTMTRRTRVHLVRQDTINKMWVKLLVYHAYPASTRI